MADKPSIIARIKKSMESGGGKRIEGMFRLKEGEKKRVRFLTDLQDFEDGVRGPYEFKMHSKWGDDGLWDTPCESYEGIDPCQYCAIMKIEGQGKDRVKLIPKYVFTVRDLDEEDKTKANKTFCYQAGGRSPIPAMMEMFEKFGTLLDRAYELKIVGKGQSKTFVLIPEAPPKNGWKRAVGDPGFEPLKRKQHYRHLKSAGGWKGEPPEVAKAQAKEDDDE